MDVLNVLPGPRKITDDVGVRCMKLFQDFLEEFKEDNEVKYLEATKELLQQERNTLEISFEDIEKYNQNLATAIIEEYYRLYPYLCQGLQFHLRDTTGFKKNKQCYIAFTDVATRHKVRELTTTKIGTLIRISGQVTRTHPVHPELISGTFVCLDCQTIISDVEQQFKFTNPTICRNPVCNNRRRFMLDVDKSVFTDFQRVRIQETQAELPRGNIPRSVEVILRAENVEAVQPGDRYDFTGTLIVVPDVGSISIPGARAEPGSRHKSGDDADGLSGLKALGVRELHYRMAFLCCSVQATDVRFGGIEHNDEITPEMMRKQMTDEEWNHMYEMSHDKNLYQHLINSLFPSIHGNDEVKRGILLMLFGGVTKQTVEGTNLRGDLNCCIVGDPSTAKSQFLKQVSEICPRSVYTSGKASSAAGLTAAVVKDSESSDFVIEAGALMLADHGVCCIDEFDKMDYKDQVAIHEAMEQQTISIAKAGVRATLNARTSILAAANPINGRYDRGKSLQQNIQLSAPIMSRFDLFFILVDECNEVVDYAIARKIVDLHSNNEQEVSEKYTKEEVLQYISFAKKFKPRISEESSEMLVHNYNDLRLRDSHSMRITWRITVRQLESMIRLSEAMAKMEISEEVKPRHVKEAFRLLNKSIIRVEQPDINFGDDKDDEPQLQSDGEENTDQTEMSTDEAMHMITEGGKKKLKLSFDEYKRISDMIIVYLRNEENKIEEGRKKETHRSDVVAWYLNMIEDKIDSEDDLIEMKDLIEKVVDRLIYHDQIIIPLTAAPATTDTGESERQAEPEEHDPVVVVHPNYIYD